MNSIALKNQNRIPITGRVDFKIKYCYLEYYGRSNTDRRQGKAGKKQGKKKKIKKEKLGKRKC